MISAREIQAFDARGVRGLSGASRAIFDRWQRHCGVRGPEVLTGLGIRGSLTYESTVPRVAVDALAGLSDPDLAAVLNVGGPGFPAVVSFRPSALLAILYSTLGVAVVEWPQDRGLSTVEQSLAEMFFEQLSREWSESWPLRDPLAVAYRRTISRTSRARVFDPAAVLLSSRFRLETDCGSQDVTCLMPLVDVEQLCAPAAPALEPKPAGSGRMADVAPLVPMPLSVELGRVQLSVLEAESLKCGDVLVLDQTTRTLLTARVAGQPKYQGRPGRVGARVCFAIETLLED